MADIILGAIVIIVSLIAIAVQSKLMSKQTFAGFVLALVLAVSGANLAISLTNSSNFASELASVCNGQKEVARTGAEALVEQREESVSFLSKSSFPGFTQEELRALIHNKDVKAEARVKRLETVAENTCRGH